MMSAVADSIPHSKPTTCPCDATFGTPPLLNNLIRGHHANHLECLLFAHPELEPVFFNNPKALLAQLIGSQLASKVTEQYDSEVLPNAANLNAVVSRAIWRRSITLSHHNLHVAISGQGDDADQALENAYRHAALALVANELADLPPMLTGIANSLHTPLSAPPSPAAGIAVCPADPNDFANGATEQALESYYPEAVSQLLPDPSLARMQPLAELRNRGFLESLHWVTYTRFQAAPDLYFARATVTTRHHSVFGDARSLWDARRLALYHLLLKCLTDPKPVDPDLPSSPSVRASQDLKGQPNAIPKSPSRNTKGSTTTPTQVDPFPHRQDLAALQRDYAPYFERLRTWPLASEFPLTKLIESPHLFLKRVMQLFKIDAVKLPQGWYRATGTTYTKNYFGDGDSEVEAKRAAYLHLIVLLVKGDVKNKHFRHLVADASRAREWEHDQQRAGHDRRGWSRDRDWSVERGREHSRDGGRRERSHDRRSGHGHDWRDRELRQRGASRDRPVRPAVASPSVVSPGGAKHGRSRSRLRSPTTGQSNTASARTRSRHRSQSPAVSAPAATNKAKTTAQVPLPATGASILGQAAPTPELDLAHLSQRIVGVQEQVEQLQVQVTSLKSVVSHLVTSSSGAATPLVSTAMGPFAAIQPLVPAGFPLGPTPMYTGGFMSHMQQAPPGSVLFGNPAAVYSTAGVTTMGMLPQTLGRQAQMPQSQQQHQ